MICGCCIATSLSPGSRRVEQRHSALTLSLHHVDSNLSQRAPRFGLPTFTLRIPRQCASRRVVHHVDVLSILRYRKAPPPPRRLPPKCGPHQPLCHVSHPVGQHGRIWRSAIPNRTYGSCSGPTRPLSATKKRGRGGSRICRSIYHFNRSPEPPFPRYIRLFLRKHA